MLVLSRNEESAINIGSEIKVKILSIKRNSVKLGVEAPRSVRVWRDELPLQIDAHKGAEGNSHGTAEMRVVLVVEDDPGHARLICKALGQQQGTQVTVADTSRNALDALGARASTPDQILRPDLILLDLGLPDGSGLDLLRMIRSVPELRTTPVVVLSCSDDESLVNQCIESGANAYVPKSAGYEDFHSQVSRIGQFWAGDCFTRRGFSGGAMGRSAASPHGAATDSATAVEVKENQKEADSSKRILVADDDPGHVTLIKRALRHAHINCAVDAVGDGMGVIDYLFSNDQSTIRDSNTMPDLILLDLNMPKMNGRQVLQTLRSVHSQQRLSLPPVVVLTSSEEDADISDSYELGAQSFIRKPADHSRFTMAVQQTTKYWLGLNKSGSPETRVRSSRAPR